MNSGLVAFIFGLLALISAWVMGKAKGKEETTTRISGEITIQKQKAAQAEAEADLLKDSTPIVIEAATRQTEAEKEYERTLVDISKASRESDMDAMKAIAQAMAEKALRMGATPKGGDK